MLRGDPIVEEGGESRYVIRGQPVSGRGEGEEIRDDATNRGSEPLCQSKQFSTVGVLNYSVV